jgi:hypothetical protein
VEISLARGLMRATDWADIRAANRPPNCWVAQPQESEETVRLLCGSRKGKSIGPGTNKETLKR